MKTETQNEPYSIASCGDKFGGYKIGYSDDGKYWVEFDKNPVREITPKEAVRLFFQAFNGEGCEMTTDDVDPLIAALEKWKD